MEKIKEFVDDNKELLIAGVGMGLSWFLGYKIGYKKGFKIYQKIVIKTFDIMKDSGAAIVRVIK